MKKTSLLFALAAGLCLLASCSTPKLVNTHMSPNQNWADVKTFDFVAFKSDSLRKIGKTYDIEVIREAIEREMIMRGFSKNEKNDLLINLGVTIEPKAGAKQQNTPVYLGAEHYMWDKAEIVLNGAPAVTYSEGELTMQLVNTKTGKLVWESSVSNLMKDLKKGKVKTPQQVVDAVSKLFSKFPVEKKQ